MKHVRLFADRLAQGLADAVPDNGQLATARDDLATLAGKGWRALVRVDEPLKSWLDDMLASHGPGGARL